ncbi:MAG: response regulator [Desulfobacteraceae bacterium]|nr:response regulator [Desulfobacteraceae bacterium]
MQRKSSKKSVPLPEDKKSLKALVIKLQKEKVEQKKSRKILIKNREQYKTLFNNIADIIFLFDVETHYFVDCNDRALNYGYTKEELLTMTPFDLHLPEELNTVGNEIDAMNETPGTGNRYQHVMKDGTQIDVEILTSEIEYNGRPTWVSIVRDITDRKRFENAIIKKQKEAEAASKAKSEFLAKMSHEIRTPMNGVIGMLDILLETDLSEEQNEFAVTAQQSAESLLALINDILDFSKIEAGKLDIETIDFNLTVTLSSLSALLSIKAFEKGIDFACLIENEVPLLLKGDPSRLRQILSNLTGNALKFTTEGEIFIKVSVKKETKKEVTLLFEVMDTGTGIPEDKLNTLFESFSQVDASTTRKYGGTGLGLAISRQLANLMGGEISVTSEFGKGSNFYLTVAFEKQTETKQKLVLADDIKGTKILIINDTNTNQKILKEYFKSWSCPFDKANNGAEALLMLKKAAKASNPYKIVLFDIQTPYQRCKEFSKTIKNDKDIHKTLLIMLSSIADRGDVKKLKKAGFAGFLTKPIKKTQLFDTIRAVLSIDSQGIDKYAESMITSYKVEEIKKVQTKNSPKLKILLVEDNIINQLVAKKMLGNMAKTVTIANNGKEAIDLFLKNKFDLIFMDIQMPVMDGEEATKKIRDYEKKSGGHIPIIALTANAMEGDREHFLACGIDEYLTKPIKKKNFEKTINSLGLT